MFVGSLGVRGKGCLWGSQGVRGMFGRLLKPRMSLDEAVSIKAPGFMRGLCFRG